jgi:hypothetical protein
MATNHETIDAKDVTTHSVQVRGKHQKEISSLRFDLIRHPSSSREKNAQRPQTRSNLLAGLHNDDM